jgi:pilus assembly protein CpaF
MPPDPVAIAATVHAQLLGDGGTAGDVATVTRRVRAVAPLASAEVVASAVAAVASRCTGLGPLDDLLADALVSEVMVNGPGPVWVERAGTLHCTDVIVDVATIEQLLERIVAPLGLRLDRTSPLVDARLPDGSRVNAVVAPLAVDGPCLTIRRFGARAIPLAELCERGVADLLTWAVRGRCNLIVSGGTGAGKTTLLNALAAVIPPTERIVTIEDAAELRLAAPHVVRLEARPSNADGVGAVSLRALVRNALRMRPDRIVVGEARGPEALDVLQAMNTGHEGSLSTCHANSPADALRRLETMVLMGDVALPLDAVRDQIAASVDFVVHIERCRDGARRVVAVAEVIDGWVGAGDRVRLLADAAGVLAQPSRPARTTR